MMLAQGSPELTGNWAAFYAVLVMMITHIGRWFADARKERREVRERQDREKLEAEIARMRQQTLNRIASSNDESVTKLGEISMKLQDAHTLGRVRHETVIDKLNGVCKAECEREPRIKPKNIFDGSKTAFPI